MGKNYILLVMLLITSFFFGQEKTSWGEWAQHPCYKGIWFRVQRSSYNKTTGVWTYNSEYHNRYSQKVKFCVGDDIKSADYGEYNGSCLRIVAEPNAVESWYAYSKNPNGVNIYIANVCFNFPTDGSRDCSWETNRGEDTYVAGYAECDNGIPTYKRSGWSNGQSSNNNNYDNTSQQNNTYSNNRNKTELDRKIQEENTKRQQEASINQVNQQKQFNNAVTQSKNSMQSGDYSGAMQEYANAATTATTKGEKQLATGGVIISGLAGIADAWQKSSKKKQERKLQEAEAGLKKAEAELKKAEDDAKKAEEKEEKYKGWFETIKSQPLDYIIIKDTVTIQSVINNHIMAIGGLEKLKAVKNITTSTESKILPTETYHKNKSVIAYGKFVSNTTYSGINLNPSKTVFNGITGYLESNDKKKNFDSESIAMYKNTQPIDILKLQQNVDLELEKQIILFGSEGCYAIIERSKYKEYNYVKKHYFSRDSGLCLGVESVTTGPNNYSSTSYTFYEDYREVDGILFSFTQRTHIRYLGFNSEYRYSLSGTTTTEIKINEPLTDRDFE